MTKKGCVGLMAGILLLLWGPDWSRAAELGTLYRGIRPLGMGGAFMTLSDDDNALFYNPAGLNRIDGFGAVALANPLVEASSNTLSLLQDVQDLKGESTAQITSFLTTNIGKLQHVRVAVFPSLTTHNFGIGVLGQGTADILIENPAFPSVATDVKLDVGGVIGFAHDFMDERLQVGVTGKFVQRKGQIRTFTVADIAATTTDFFKDKTAEDWALDIGAQWNSHLFLSPTFAVVVQNITDLDFSAQGLGILPQQINIGAAINPKFWILETTLAIEIDDVTKEVGTDSDLYKRTHLGAEVRFPKILTLRAGVNQGYLTAGLDLDFWLLKFGYANYAEELGTFSGQLVDRRHVAQITIGF